MEGTYFFISTLVGYLLNLKATRSQVPIRQDSGKVIRNALEQDQLGELSIHSDELSVKPIIKKISDNSGEIIVIGIAGGSGSGKTTMAQAIYKEIGAERITYISHDSYYMDQSHLTSVEREGLNFDHPSILDTDLLVQHILQLRSGCAVDIPRYDFATHTRAKETDHHIPNRIILVEGILIFTSLELIKLMDVKIFVDTADDIRFIRRLQRDTTERKRDISSVISQYLSTVRPMHLEFVEPSKQHADIIVPYGLNSVALDLIVGKLQRDLNNSV